MSETGNKSHEVRQMLAAGRELSDEQRRSLLRLQARLDKLWERREGAQGRAPEQHRAEHDAQP